MKKCEQIETFSKVVYLKFKLKVLLNFSLGVMAFIMYFQCLKLSVKVFLIVFVDIFVARWFKTTRVKTRARVYFCK